MKKRQIAKSVPHTEHTTCSWCGVEDKFVGERYPDDNYAMVYCPHCQKDFDIQLEAGWEPNL